MKEKSELEENGAKDCCPDSKSSLCDCGPTAGLKPFATSAPKKSPEPCRCPETDAVNDAEDIACCGPPAGPPAGTDEMPGYDICSFVTRFADTEGGKVPIVSTRLEVRDFLGTFSVRIGIGRNDYKVAPGVYGVGNPDENSPVLVTANYKLTFDSLRKSLADTDAWILVLDTRGINVWCAAGKGTFATGELVGRVKSTGLERLVSHRELIVPQLGATGVSAHRVKKDCGFGVVWGPVKAGDLPAFLKNGRKASDEMRSVTFTLGERLVLIPVEFGEFPKSFLWAILLAFVLSGFGTGIFSFSAAWDRGLLVLAAYLGGIIGGTVAAPALLPWLPGRAFAVKGVWTGIAAGLALALICWNDASAFEISAMVVICTGISSFLAMNFTGSTPFTSPSGVEKEMRKAIPIQGVAMLVAAATWIGAGFI